MIHYLKHVSMCRNSIFNPNNIYPAPVDYNPLFIPNSAAFSLNILPCAGAHFHVWVGPVRLNYLEWGYICRDIDVLQSVVKW